MFKYYALITTLAFASSIAPLSTDMYLPALSLVENDFNTSAFYTQLSLTSFFCAFAFGQLIYGPLSDAYGRKKPLIIGLILFIISSIICISVENIYIFILCRFLQALGGCAGVVIARAIVNDLFDSKKALSVFAIMMVISSLAPMLSPSFGGLLLKFFSWHSIFICLFVLGIILLLMVFLFLDESLKSKSEFSLRQSFTNYKIVLNDKIFLSCVLLASFAISSMFAYITSSSFIFIKEFNLSEQAYAILFGANALGFVIFANINAYLAKKIQIQKLLSYAVKIMFLASILMLIVASLKIFILFEMALFVSLAMLGFIMPNTTVIAMQRFKALSGSASALIGAIQFAFATFVSFLVGFLQANSAIALASVVIICMLLANIIFTLAFKNNN
ncbi:multidrug effflux MFS transporter [Campylobacter canadensis]|uniref:Multidrug effflux MFS transporter n=1 Tax=Campylobacter canadensis TaxID=449520 RepID=A0ABS7WRP9_9BACT|nr:multidrug effflux MFS transporter [Campylobacter canadensis]MBZ7987416.1 multidrug effflux MFS transporter [Campylobacter canadensis]MBZ7998611.1 multidrug effflux MFS transporter [Campylobacter canadensis]